MLILSQSFNPEPMATAGDTPNVVAVGSGLNEYGDVPVSFRFVFRRLQPEQRVVQGLQPVGQTLRQSRFCRPIRVSAGRLASVGSLLPDESVGSPAAPRHFPRRWQSADDPRHPHENGRARATVAVMLAQMQHEAVP